MLVKTEKFVRDGVGMVRECYGPDEGTVTGTIEYTESAENAGQPEGQVPEATQLDRIEAQTAYIAMMMDGGGM